MCFFTHVLFDRPVGIVFVVCVITRLTVLYSFLSIAVLLNPMLCL